MQPTFLQKCLVFVLILVVGIVGLFSAQPMARASDRTPQQSLSIIDSHLFGRSRTPSRYTAPLNTLSDRCSTTPEHIADMSAVLTKKILDNGRNFDNLSFLKQALDATADGLYGMSCEEIFVLLENMIEQGT